MVSVGGNLNANDQFSLFLVTSFWDYTAWNCVEFGTRKNCAIEKRMSFAHHLLHLYMTWGRWSTDQKFHQEWKFPKKSKMSLPKVPSSTWRNSCMLEDSRGVDALQFICDKIYSWRMRKEDTKKFYSSTNNIQQPWLFFKKIKKLGSVSIEHAFLPDVLKVYTLFTPMHSRQTWHPLSSAGIIKPRF